MTAEQTAQHQKYADAIKRGGQANQILGWLWLVNGAVWATLYLVFSLKTQNPFLTVGSIIASIGGSIFIVAIVLSVLMGILHLYIGTYVTKVHGSKIKLFLLIGGIASIIFFLSIIPVIFAVFSFYGFYAAQKLGSAPELSSEKHFSFSDIKKLAIVTGCLIIILIGLTVAGYIRFHHGTVTASAANASGGKKGETINEFNASSNSNKVFGYCSTDLSVAKGCRYTSNKDNFTVTFPANSKFSGAPFVVVNTSKSYADKQASGTLMSAFTGYGLDLLYFSNTSPDQSTLNQRLIASVNDVAISGACAYSPDNSATTETVAATTYQNLQGDNIVISGQGLDNKPCTFYAFTFMNDKTAFVLWGLNSSANTVTLADFNAYESNFNLIGAPSPKALSIAASGSTNSQTPKTLTIDMYIDYQSPFSNAYYSTIQQVLPNFGSRVMISYKDFPLEQVHANALAAAKAAEAAKLQGKLSGMQTFLLLNNQTNWPGSSTPLTFFDDYATKLGLNVSQFNTDYSSLGVLNTINSDIQTGKSAGVNAIPTFFFNNTLVNNSSLTTVSAFSAEVNQYLE